MKRKITFLIAAAALCGTLLVTAAFGATSSASSPQAAKGAVVALGKTPLGKVLVDARGHTLYLFDKDTRGRSACNGACVAYWPPLLSTARPRAAQGVHASLLGVIKRADGKRQVTYAGHPLYAFFGDKRAGQTNGEGLTDFGAAWDAVAAGGRSVEPPASGSSGSSIQGGYGGYGSSY